MRAMCLKRGVIAIRAVSCFSAQPDVVLPRPREHDHVYFSPSPDSRYYREQEVSIRVYPGYKVGVMEQLETAAEAKKRNPKKAIIKRQLTQISTPATTLNPDGSDAVHLLALHASDVTGAPPLPPGRTP
jgi:MutS domain I